MLEFGDVMKVTAGTRVNLPPSAWSQIITWLPHSSNNEVSLFSLLQAWHACVYEIWCERNRRYHLGVTLPPRRISQKICLILKNKAVALSQTGASCGPPLLLCWS
ncbi:unnamed protein product [Microthlaspi erraticum]|uniref:Uncharacterized protein n=1 Tax=Microthlaspi erraticum TaxID=1685480 RepID=A0A6D2K0Q7_9BRAS|nr:unnamed protein product [Microthlaspi erraticum]